MQRLVILLAVLCVFVGCAAHGGSPGLSSSGEASVSFSGEIKGAAYRIDDEPKVSFDELGKEPPVSVSVAAGKHSVRVYRGIKMLVDETVMLEKGETLEVDVPLK